MLRCLFAIPGRMASSQLSMNKILSMLLLLIAACTTTTPTPTPIVSAWGEIFTLGQAEQMDAPAVWPFQDQVVAAWVGADETGIHQDIRGVSNSGLLERVVLPLPPKNPYAQQMYPDQNGNVHLLWLDADENGVLGLYAALITPQMQVERGPTLISGEITRRFAVIPNGDGSIWVISSGGLAIEPSLYARLIDAQGRPRSQENYQIAGDADWPTVLSTNDGTVYLFWIRHSDGSVMRSTLTNGITDVPQPISQTVMLNAGDRLLSFNAALDVTHGYLFWNVSRADGSAETWFTSGALEAEIWEAPIRMGFDRSKGNFETGFNSGTVGVARTGDNWLSWTVPLAGQFNVLPVATTNGGNLGIVYLQGGGVVGYQDIVMVSRLIGLPALLTDRDRFLYLSWSEPGASGKADLKLTITRRF
jgi:hypothetical protein